MERELIAEKSGFKVYLARDEDPQNPRDDDNVGTMVCWHRNYILGDDQPKERYPEWLRDLAADKVNANDADLIPDEHIERIIDKHFIMLPLYLYDHSGITMSTSEFSCPWDSGQVGVIYVAKDKAREEWPEADENDSYKRAIKCLVSEVETYDQYLTGDVYGYMLEGPDGEEDSCWGYFGYEYAQEEASSVLEWHVNKANKRGRYSHTTYICRVQKPP